MSLKCTQAIFNLEDHGLYNWVTVYDALVNTYASLRKERNSQLANETKTARIQNKASALVKSLSKFSMSTKAYRSLTGFW